MKLKSHTVPQSDVIFAHAKDSTPVNRLARAYRVELDKHYARDTGAVREAIVQEVNDASSVR